METKKIEDLTNDERSQCLRQEEQVMLDTVISATYENYREALNKQTVKQDELIRQLADQNVFYLSNSKQKKSFSIQQIKRNFDGSSRTLQISLCQFVIRINIYINSQESQIHKQQIYQRGSYGRIYVDKLNMNPFVVKCLSCGSLKDYKFMKHAKDIRQFHKDVVDILKEYSFIKIFSALKAGPKAINPYGFDIIFNATCGQFCEQLCESNFIKYIYSKQNLMRQLKRFHSLRIIHNDIKPQNIVFSHQFSSTVFCDFGLTQIVKENVGQKTLTRFRGSLAYSSAQMGELFQKEQPSYVDLYYNDLHCLQKAIQTSRKREYKHSLYYQCCNENITEIPEQKQSITIILHKYKLFMSQCQSISELPIQPTAKMQFIYLTEILDYCLTLNLTDFNKKFIESLTPLIKRNPNLIEKFTCLKQFCQSELKIQQFLAKLNISFANIINVDLSVFVENITNSQSKEKEKIKNINLRQHLQTADSQLLSNSQVRKQYFDYFLIAYVRWISAQPYYDLQNKIKLTHIFIRKMNIKVQIEKKVHAVTHFEQLQQIHLLLSFIRQKFTNWPIWIEKSQVLRNIGNCYISLFDQYQIFKEIYEQLITEQNVPLLKINYIVQYFFCRKNQLFLSQIMDYSKKFRKIEQLVQVNEKIFKNYTEVEQLKVSMKIFSCFTFINSRKSQFSQLQLFKILREIEQKRWQYNLNYKIILLTEEMLLNIQRNMDQLKSIERLHQKLQIESKNHFKSTSRRITNVFEQIVRKLINMGALSKAKKMLTNQRKRVDYDKWFYNRYSFLFIYLSFAKKEWQQTYRWFDQYFSQLSIFRKFNLFCCFYRKLEELPASKYSQDAVILLNHYRVRIGLELDENADQLKKLDSYNQLRFTMLFERQLKTHINHLQQARIKNQKFIQKFIQKAGDLESETNLYTKHIIAIEQRYQQLLTISNINGRQYLPQDTYKSRQYEDWQINRILSCTQVLLKAFNKRKGYANAQIPCKIAYEYAYWLLQHFDCFDFINNFQFIRYSLDMNMRSCKHSEVIKFMLVFSQANTALSSRQIYRNYTYSIQWIVQTGQPSLLIQILTQLNKQYKFKIPLHKAQFYLFVSQLLKRIVIKEREKISYKVLCRCLKELFTHVDYYYVETKKKILSAAVQTFLTYLQLYKQKSLVKRKRRYLQRMIVKVKMTDTASSLKIKNKQELLKLMFGRRKQILSNNKYSHYNEAFRKIHNNLKG